MLAPSADAQVRPVRAPGVPGLLLALTLAAGLGLGTACAAEGDDSPSGRTRPRAVVIGIDGADWKVIDALAAEGALPHLSALRARGVWGELATLNDIALSPVIWTSVATGKTAAGHGIAWFMVDQPDGTRVPVQSTNRTAEAIWNILARQGLAAVVVGWWATFPAEAIGPGAIVSDALGFHGFGSTARGGDDGRKTYPAETFPEVDALVPPEQQVSLDFARRFLEISGEEYRAERFDPARSRQRDPSNAIHLFQEYAVTAQGYCAISEHLLEHWPYDLFMVYFEQVDSFSHLFMKYAPPRLEWVDDAGFERYRNVVHEWYRYQDELLGRILAHVDLDETAVFVLSDHGFKSGDRRIRGEELVDLRRAHLDHETHGIFIAAGPHLRTGGIEIEGASVLDITPTLLHYLGLAVGKDMAGKVLESAFVDGFLDAHSITYVSTHEDGRSGSAAAVRVGSADPAELAAIEDGLRTLGYLGPETGEVSAAPAVASSPEQHNGLGRVHLQDGDPERALVEFERALELDPRNADALINIAAIHQADGRADRAQHFVERALQVDPSSVAALAQLAEIRRDQGRLEEALRLFSEALAIDDSQPFLFIGMGDVLQRSGRFEEAVRAFESALELAPDSFKAHYNLGVTYANMGRAQDAIDAYEKALELEPGHPQAAQALNNVGAIFLAQGERDRALEKFEASMEASSLHIEPRFNAALLYLEQDRVDEAVELLEQAAALAPNHEWVNTRLGLAYIRSGRAADAYRSLLLVRRLYPGNWAASVGLAALHAGGGEMDPARQLLTEALELGGGDAREFAARFEALAPLLGE